MRQEAQNLINDFIGAMNCKSATGYRIYAEMPDGKVGVTPIYTAVSIPHLIADIEKAGHKVLRVEQA